MTEIADDMERDRRDDDDGPMLPFTSQSGKLSKWRAIINLSYKYNDTN